MDVVTKSGEVVNISEKQVYTFPNGLLGFENFKKYALIESEYEPFFWLQSLDEKNLAFDKGNFIALGISVVIILVGLILMSGDGSTTSSYNPDIFSVRRIKIAPVVTFIGFVSIIYAVMRKPKSK